MGTFKWTVEIEVDETWVADGFDITEPESLEGKLLPYAHSDEINVKVLKKPSKKSIRKAQGYE